MEIEIDSKRNNPLLNRTEVYFTVKHLGEKTPNRELIRSELAEKLNTKKENVIVNAIHTSFGLQETTGYAKIYSSNTQAKDIERKHILKRNKIGEAEAKQKPKEKAEAKAEETKIKETEDTPKEEPEQKTDEKPAEETNEQKAEKKE